MVSCSYQSESWWPLHPIVISVMFFLSSPKIDIIRLEDPTHFCLPCTVPTCEGELMLCGWLALRRWLRMVPSEWSTWTRFWGRLRVAIKVLQCCAKGDGNVFPHCVLFLTGYLVSPGFLVVISTLEEAHSHPIHGGPYQRQSWFEVMASVTLSVKNYIKLSV